MTSYTYDGTSQRIATITDLTRDATTNLPTRITDALGRNTDFTWTAAATC